MSYYAPCSRINKWFFVITIVIFVAIVVVDVAHGSELVSANTDSNQVAVAKVSNSDTLPFGVRCLVVIVLVIYPLYRVSARRLRQDMVPRIYRSK